MAFLIVAVPLVAPILILVAGTTKVYSSSSRVKNAG